MASGKRCRALGVFQGSGTDFDGGSAASELAHTSDLSALWKLRPPSLLE